ncbi:lasso peptide biosynthesis B2 protein [Phenylobacterium sp.]|uniref:lasso peptide biosynthesis B2 protein n=1 Tax=Phenylobacterium sp. TaxID=1871053 RepID=UPI0035684D0E
MTAHLYLQRDVHAVAVADDIVVLNITSDSYQCLPGGSADLAIGRNGAITAPEPLADALMAAGLAQTEPPFGRRNDPPPLPTRVVAPDAIPQPPRVRDLATLALCLLDLQIHYRGRSFAHILASVRQSRPRHRGDESADALTLAVKQFRRAAIWLPAPRKCLMRSFVLLRFLQRSGLDADWVIAVRTWPFAAHCWLQAGDVVLDEVPDRALAFRPIAVA